MSHGVHAVQHEAEHQMHHDKDHGKGGGHNLLDGRNKKIALLIALLALCLAFSETLGKSAQTNALSFNIEAANLWAFFQAKNIRRTTVQTAAEEMRVELAATTDDALKAARSKQVKDWSDTAARYRSEPKKGPKGEELGEGTQELMIRARDAEKKRDLAMERYHHYEVASAAFQIGIVLASATVITGMLALTWIAGGLALVGVAFMAIGLFAPSAVHLF
jgi:hypothetical protein